MAGSYQQGDLVRISATFKNSAGTAIDPTSVKAHYKKPDGTKVTKTYPTDAEVVKDSTGNYRMDIDANAAGVWKYGWSSTGTGQAAEQSEFHIAAWEFA